MLPVLGALGAVAAPVADYVLLATFDGAEGTTQTWHELNDPVMGGRSTGTFRVDTDANIAVFNGTARIVPSLSAPGFCNAETYAFADKFASAAGFDNLFIVARTTVPEYQGFKFSWAADTLNPQFKSFKSTFNFQKNFEWEVINFPLSKFSNDWSAFTGDCSTTDPNGQTHQCCDSAHPEVCPTSSQLADISQLGIWAEGYEGSFRVDIKAIGAGHYELGLP